MKVVHVFSVPQSAFYFMEGQLQYMISNGVEVHVIMPNDNYYSNFFLDRDSDVVVHFLDFTRDVSLRNDFMSLIRLIKLFHKIKVDIIHLHTPKASFIGALASRILCKKIVIFQMHGLVSVRGNKINKKAIYLLEKITCSLATHIFAVSQSLLNFAIENKYCREKKISVIHNGTINGIDTSKRFNRENIKNNIPFRLNTEKLENKFVVGFVGRISIDKGIEDYLEVIKLLDKERIPVLGLIVGPNELKKDLKCKVKNAIELLGNKVVNLGEIQQSEIIMKHFDVLLLPSKREGFGLVAAEANALKIPVVGYNIFGLKDAIENNFTGKLVDYGDVKKMFECVSCYFKNVDLKITHGLNGRRRVVELYNQQQLWEAILKKYKSLEKNV